MDTTIKVRSVARRHFSKSANAFENLIKSFILDPSKINEVVACRRVLKQAYDELITQDVVIRNEIIGGEQFDESVLDKEFEECGKYKARWALLDTWYENIMKDKPSGSDRKFKLPVLEIKKFDGSIKQWLTFWGQFKKIDNDTTIDDTDKLQYLSQSMEPGSEVRAFVESFPLSTQSYKSCLNELKSRYAREDLLIQMYVRELLTLILSKEENLTILYDNINSHLRALEVLGVTKEKYAAFLLPMVESALPTDMLKIWERSKPTDIKDELGCLLTFLRKEVEGNQRIELASTFKTEKCKNEPTAACFTVQSRGESHREVKCIWCDKGHPSTECYKIAKMTLEERREFLKQKKACVLCMKIGHFAKNCKSYIKCYVCGLKHSPILCPGTTSKATSIEKPNSEKKQSMTIQNHSQASGGTTLLQTVKVKIIHGEKSAEVRCLFDSGSQRSYVKKEVMDKIGVLPTGTEELSHSLFGGVTVSLQNYNNYDFRVHSMDNKFEFDMSALGQNTICKNVPKVNLRDHKSLSELLNINQIELADKGESTEIGLLIGGDYSGFLMTNNIVQVDSRLTAIQTKLGWTLLGRIYENTSNCNVVTAMFTAGNINLSDFWNLEVLGIKDSVQVESKQQKEEEVMKNFEESIKVNSEGRYEVDLPWKTGHDDLLSNRELAKHRLLSSTKRLVQSGKFQDYDNIIREWEKTGVIEPVPDAVIDKKVDIHYLPHRAVFKEASLTTKLRPVFDASAKDKNGKSLNASLDKGINFLDKIPDLLLGFRKDSIGVSADIAKAFLQISVSPEDRDYLRFLWWRDEARQELVELRHCRVVFGLTSSPFLLSATILHHLEQVNNNRKATAEILKRSFYVDNLVTSLDSEKTMREFMQDAKDIMEEAKFDLRQWVTSPLNINETGKTVISVLGLLWDTASDELYCNLSTLPDPKDIGKVDKRTLLSLTQRIFDVVGIVSPVTLIPRLLLQEIWNRKLNWDEELPTDILKRFHDWYDNIKCLENCRVPRRLSAERLQECETSMHMFCDASKDGYAACVFLRTESKGNVTVRLISAKSRITPPEKITIPRLELLAALIGSRLVAAVRKQLQLKNCKEFCWTDSGVALCWIKRELTWNTYVGNRVKEIRQNTDTNNWHHIPGTENWADLASRGCDARELLEVRWWEGPPWLLRPPALWPHSALVVDEKEVIKEARKTTQTNACLENGMMQELAYFSKYTKIVRMTAWMLRFAHNTRFRDNKRKGELSYEEYEEAENKIIKWIQENYKEIIEKQIGKLTQFYDDENLLRIKTKLLLTDYEQDVKTPVVLPAKNDVVRRMVEQRHIQLLHAGTNMMIVDLRKRFWIIGVRKLVKSVIEKCAVCKRHRAKATQATTAPLPVERVQASAPFAVTGVDMAGPLYLLDGQKCWIVMYTCAVYRAVHLELTQSLSTDAFLRTFRRFIARRGRVELMISDNGTNFTGAKNLLSSIDWDEVQRQSTILRIKWKLNAPAAAWWGGFFERMIKIIKNILRRVLGMSSVSYEEMQTLLCDCEAVVNDRPLTYVEGDNADSLEPLRPSCFLQTLPTTQVTDLDILDSTNLNRRLRYLQRLREDFRQRFKNEYLTELVQKGREKEDSLKVGDIVLLETEEKRVKWPLGRIVELYKGKDGVNRTAKLKTSTGFKTRPFQRLYKLELSFSEVEGSCESRNPNVECKNSLGKKYNIVLNPSSIVIKRKVDNVNEENEDKLTRRGRVIRLPSKFKI